MKICLFILGAISFCGCSTSPGRPVPGDLPGIPSEISDFNVLYTQNCAGCHGAGGKGGAAIALDNPAYLTVADDAALQSATAKGISGTSMPAFAQSAGGMLTAAQVDVIVKGIRERWSKPDLFQGADPPPYKSSAPGDASRGAEVYSTYCSSCHGVEGRGGQKAGSIVNGSFLALVNDQELRTIVITGRPELGAPDWRSDVPGRPMNAQEVSDVVAWLASQRPRYPGQPFPTSAKAMGEIQ
ncbi:MAG TPA: cytochrome c [Candidatus Acidoferrales bacterium]|jgi:mono/diheme cytochrome c family protein|nr:cytochrome c [Candidatus Acidoferrales bacterium]